MDLIAFVIQKLGANDRHSILEKWNYIPWESRFRRFLYNKLEDGERMWCSIEKGPYERPLITNPDDDKDKILKPLSKMTDSNKKQYIAKEMWERFKRLMFGSDVTNHDGRVDIQTKNAGYGENENDFMLDNSFGDETLKELTAVVIMMARIQPADDNRVQNPNYDGKDVNKRSIKNGPYERQLIIYPDDDKEKILEPLTKMSKSNKKQYIANVKVINYLLQAIPNDIYNLVDACKNAKEMWEQTKRLMFGSDVTNYDGKVDIQTKNAGYGGNAMKYEAGSNLNDEENDFMLDNSFEHETFKEITATVIKMARIQPADDNGVQKPNYDAKVVSEVNASRRMIPKGVHEHKNHGKRKTVINTSDDDQIAFNNIFDDPYVENNSGSDERDSTTHDQIS
nr:hypothetical protein [Tanacetum cinerariifolium]